MIDNASNRVCAHVLAFSERNNTAYIAPMDVLLEDISRTLKVSVTLPPYPPVLEEKVIASVTASASYSPPDTPPPSPPLATSPDPPCVRSMESLSLVGTVAKEDIPDIPDNDTLRKVSANCQPPSKTESMHKVVGVGGDNSTAMKRRSNGIQARG